MYITSVVSNLGAWQKLCDERYHIINDIKKALLHIRNKGIYKQEMSFSTKKHEQRINLANFEREFVQYLQEACFEKAVRLPLPASTSHSFFEIDAIKERVGIEMFFGKWAFVESMLFSKFPMFIQSGKIDVAIVLLPTKSLNTFLPIGSTSFEFIRDTLISNPVTLKYPFAILGFSPEEHTEVTTELTSNIDRYLIDSFGLRLSEMLITHEMPFFDFKANFSGGDRFKETVCAFSNIKNGGIFLFGIANDGLIPGIQTGKHLDGIKLGVDNVIKKIIFNLLLGTRFMYLRTM